MSSSLKNLVLTDTSSLGLPSGTSSQQPVQLFTAVGTTTWTVPTGVTSVSVLVVAGGGGGSADRGGAGGAGGLTYNSAVAVTPGAAITINVGAGGAGSGGAVRGISGTASVFGNLIANGTFDTNTTGWTSPGTATLSVVSGAMRITNLSANGRAQYLPGFTTVPGRSYIVSVTGINRTASNYYFEIRSGVEASNTWASGSAQQTFTAVQTTTYIELYALGATGIYAEYDNVSVSETGLTAVGGGGGGSSDGTKVAGLPGGSGGGAGNSNGADATSLGGAGTAGQGFAGGSSTYTGTVFGGGGGGGAGGVGQAGTGTYAGNGGPGLAFSISGTVLWYAGGGGAGAYAGTANGVGGSLVGGNGTATTVAGSGATNTGSGGGSSGNASGGGAGAAGIVIVSWATPGMIRYNTTKAKVETYTGARNTPSANANGWVTDGLACLLDAGDIRSYPGTGTVWYDISGNNRHFNINASQAIWNSAGTASYFNCPGTNTVGDYSNFAFIGPASDNWGFDQEHYIEAVTNVTAAATNWFFHFSSTNKNAFTFADRLSCHFVYGGNASYYDVHGCCDATSRIVYQNSDRDFIGAIRQVAWRTRTTELPYRQMFRNGVSVIDSGHWPTDVAVWNKKTASVLCGGWNGKLYYIAIYNRALTDTERAANYAVLQARYGL